MLLGHADLSHTTVYLHLSRRHLQAAPNPLEQLRVPTPAVLHRSTAPPETPSVVSRPAVEVADILHAQGDTFALRQAFDRGDLDLAGGSEHRRDRSPWRAFVNGLFETDWVVYAKPAFGGASAVLRYLGRYTHRVAISNHRWPACDGERVMFQWKDYAHGDQRRTMTLSALEFLRRFVQHILPRGFVRIRQPGFLANTCRRARLALARTLLANPAPARPSTPTTAIVTPTITPPPVCGPAPGVEWR